jgi:hypothetical protein
MQISVPLPALFQAKCTHHTEGDELGRVEVLNEVHGSWSRAFPRAPGPSFRLVARQAPAVPNSLPLLLSLRTCLNGFANFSNVTKGGTMWDKLYHLV